MIDAVGQESYIAHKLDTLMQSVNLSVLHFENKDVYLGIYHFFFSQLNILDLNFIIKNR